MRAWRKVLFEESLDYEIRTEMNEGTAQYVEWCVLKQINVLLYEKIIDNAKGRLQNISSYKNLRHSCYDSGALIAILLDQMDYSWKKPIPNNEELIMNTLLENRIPEAIAYESHLELENMIDTMIHMRREKIEKILENAVLIEGPFQLMGLDPMNAFQIDHQIYNPSFFGYIVDGHPKMIQGESVVVLDKDYKVQRIYCKVE
jgi:hypothetical protein